MSAAPPDLLDLMTDTFIAAMRLEMSFWSIEERPSPIIGGRDKIILHDLGRVVALGEGKATEIEQPDVKTASNALTRIAVRVGLAAIMEEKADG